MMYRFLFYNMSNDASSKRIFWLDAAKAYGMFLVFYGHLTFNLVDLDITVNTVASTQSKFIFSFHMPLFFLLSGYLSKNSVLNLKYRLASRIVPFIFFNLASLALLVIEDAITKQLNSKFYVSGLIHLLTGEPFFNIPTWFLVCLFTVETIDFLLWRYLKTEKQRAIATVFLYIVGITIAHKPDLFLKAVGIAHNFWFLEQSLVVLLFYKFGHFIKRSNWLEKVQSKTLYLVIFAGAVLILLLTFDLDPHGVDLLKSRYGNPIISPLSALMGSLAIIYLAKLTPFNFLYVWIGQNTLILLGVNGFFIRFINPYFMKAIYHELPNTSIAVSALCSLATITSLLLSIPLIWLLNKFLPQLIGKPNSNGPILQNLI